MAGWGERRTENIMGNLLRAGVMLAAGIVVAGGLRYLFNHGIEKPHYAIFQGEPADLRTLSGIVTDVGQFRGRSIIQLGLLVLIMTPVARVAFAVPAFLLEKDRLYVVVATIVLGILAFSLFGGGI